MDEKRLVVALVLSAAVLLLWWVVFPPPEPQRPPEQPPVEESLLSDDGLAAPPESPMAAGVERGEPELESGDELAEAVSELAASAERVVTVEGIDYEAELTNRGAQLVSYRLMEHLDREGAPVDLVRARLDGVFPFGLVDQGERPSPLNRVLWVAEETSSEGGEPVVEYKYAGPEGSASKRFTFRADGLVQVEIEVDGRDWGMVLGPGIRNPAPEELENRFAQRTGVFYLGDDVERVDAQGADQPTLVPGGGLHWVGVQDTYFLTAVIPDQRVAAATLSPMIKTADGGKFVPLPAEDELASEEEDVIRELLLVVYPGAEEFHARAFFGAKQYDRLESLGIGLEKTVNLGFFGFFAKAILRLLQWIHANIVQNYGWAIVLTTFFIRIILFPLTHKSTVSMKKMQKLNPKIQAIRAKYKSKLKDKKGRPNSEAQRKMNEEIMGLYKSEGVNPAGGCLPMILQIPVLFAFYRLLSATVELRNAPWIGWIQDLSAPDPLYVLPIVMGGSQFLQQKLAPAGGDPMQRRIFMFMPIFFTILFLNFPSGLVLYWLTNNVLTIAQQAIYNRLGIGEGPKGADEEAGQDQPTKDKKRKK